MKVTIELTAAQVKALELLNVKTAKDTQEFAEKGFANKVKGSVMNSLKSYAKNAPSVYAILPEPMRKVMPVDAFMTAGTQEQYNVLKSLGGRELKPLPELLAEILNAANSEDADAE